MENATQLRYVFGEIDERLGERNVIPLFSVSQTRGVIPRSEVSDNGGRADSVSKYKVVRKNDLVLNRFNAYRGSLGIAPGYGLVSPDYAVLRPREADPRYFDYWFRSDEISNFMKSTMGGLGAQDPDTSGFSRINLPEVMRLPIRITDEIERAKIADFLDRETAKIDVLIAKQEQLITTLGERREVLLTLALSSPRKSIDKPDSPELLSTYKDGTGWSLRSLKSVSKIRAGFSFKADLFSDSGLVPVVKQSDFFLTEFSTFTEEVPPEEFMLANGDVLISMSGDFNCVLWNRGRAGLNQRCAAVRADESKASAEWLSLVLPAALRDLSRLNFSTTVSNMSATELRTIKVAAPPLNVQTEILGQVAKDDGKVQALIRKTQSMVLVLKERRQSLISAAVTGKIDLRKGA
jgi:type I restriction enzyme S subunit